jgi:RNA-binding protein
MELTENQKKTLRSYGHKLKPVVMVGDRGISDGVLRELEIALDHHELIKVRVRAGDRESRDAMIRQLADAGHAAIVQRVGNIALLFRRNPEAPKVVLGSR